MPEIVSSIVSAILGSLVTALIATVIVGRTVATIAVRVQHLEEKLKRIDSDIRCNERRIGRVTERIAKMGG